MIAEGEHLRVVFAQILQFSRCCRHPPHVFLCSADLRQVELHVIVVEVIDQQVVVTTSGDETIVFLTILEDDALVGHTLEIGET